MATKIRGGNISVPAIDEMENRIQTRVQDPSNVRIRKAIKDLSLDSAEVVSLIDSDYILARSPAGTDSATVSTIITADVPGIVDSDYVIARAGASTDSATVENIVDSRFKFNPNTVSSNVTVDSAENAMVVGPIDIDSGVTITINGTFMVF